MLPALAATPRLNLRAPRLYLLKLGERMSAPRRSSPEAKLVRTRDLASLPQGRTTYISSHSVPPFFPLLVSLSSHNKPSHASYLSLSLLPGLWRTTDARPIIKSSLMLVHIRWVRGEGVGEPAARIHEATGQPTLNRSGKIPSN